MAVLTKSELLAKISGYIGENNDDTALSLLEDASDTLNAPDEGADWKAKYEDNDRSWRERYRARFNGTSPDEDFVNGTEETILDETQEIEDKETTIDDLFE